MSKEDVSLFSCYGAMANGKSYMEYLKAKDKEIERLNNIIRDLEIELYTKYNEHKDSECEELYARAQEDKEILDYIKVLKGSDKE